MRKRWRPPTLIGPLFGYDLVASTRRGQHTGLRILVGFSLLFTLYIVYAAQVRGFDPFANPFAPGARIDGKDMAEFAHAFAQWCLIVQFVAIILITPIVVADAIAREKERRALDFLFVTALTDREIILGKLGSRLAYMTSVILTGLPILTLTELFGGVDPELLWCGYASLLATLVSLGTLSLYCSVVSNTALQATVRSYAAAAGYLLICPCLLIPLVRSEAAIPGMVAYTFINLAVAWGLVRLSIHDLRPRAEVLPPLGVAPVKPVRRRRARATVVETEDESLPLVLPVDESPLEWRKLSQPVIWEPPELRRPPLPPIDEERPLLWKEVHLHSLTSAAAGGRRVMGVVLGLAAIPAIFIRLTIAINPQAVPSIAEFSNGVVKLGTVILGSILGLGAIAHTVNSITGERARDTLDGLLSLPVTRDEVLAAKWLGGLVSLRLVQMALLGLWLFGVTTGGLHPFAFLALVLAVAAVLEFLASLGLWLSLVSKTSLRANMAAVLCVLLIAFGPMVANQYLEMLAPNSFANRAAADTVWKAVMPIMAWLQLCVGWREYTNIPNGSITTVLTAALGYAVAAWLLWRAALSRLRRYGGKPA